MFTFISKLYSQKASDYNDIGRSSDLLRFQTPFPFRVETVDVSIVRKFRWSLQQRVCSGFSPDSLFTTRLKQGVTPKSSQKYIKNKYYSDFKVIILDFYKIYHS